MYLYTEYISHRTPPSCVEFSNSSDGLRYVNFECQIWPRIAIAISMCIRMCMRFVVAA